MKKATRSAFDGAMLAEAARTIADRACSRPTSSPAQCAHFTRVPCDPGHRAGRLRARLDAMPLVRFSPWATSHAGPSNVASTPTVSMSADLGDLRAFLAASDLTLAGLDAPSPRLHLWIDRDPTGTIVGRTGYESSADGAHALIRSVAVAATGRTRGAGSRLARHALTQAAAAAADHAWLFSRRSGPFWQKLGFAPADRDALAAALPDTHQVQLFRATGQLAREVAWSRPLADLRPTTP